MEVLSETGVAGIVFRLRAYQGPIGRKARLLVRRWKILVLTKLLHGPRDDDEDEEPGSLVNAERGPLRDGVPADGPASAQSGARNFLTQEIDSLVRLAALEKIAAVEAAARRQLMRRDVTVDDRLARLCRNDPGAEAFLAFS